MTEEQIQQHIHSLYEGDADYPQEDDDDYVYRRTLINGAINRWQNDKGVLWNELFTDTIATPAGSTLTVSSGTTQYNTPSAFLFAGGYVKIDNTTLLVVKPEQSQHYPQDPSIAYFLGNPKDGYKLVIPEAVAANHNGATIFYPFYKTASLVADKEDKLEMSDPFFAVHYVVADLYKQDNNSSQQNHHLIQAEERLSQMEIKNQMDSHYQGLSLEDTFGGIMGLSGV